MLDQSPAVADNVPLDAKTTTTLAFDVRIIFRIDNANMSVPRSRLVDLMKVRNLRYASHECRFALRQMLSSVQAQCQVFATTFNPEGVRMGTKVLRQRLKGPAVAAYYPRRTATLVDLKKMFPALQPTDEVEEDRLEHIEE